MEVLISNDLIGCQTNMVDGVQVETCDSQRTGTETNSPEMCVSSVQMCNGGNVVDMPSAQDNYKDALEVWSLPSFNIGISQFITHVKHMPFRPVCIKTF